jgi:hypothetical protein
MIANKADVLARLIQLIGQASMLPDDDLKTQPTLADELSRDISLLSCDLNDATFIPESPDEEVLREVTTKMMLKDRDYIEHAGRMGRMIERIFGLIAHRAPQVIMESEFGMLRRQISVLEEKYKEETF